MNNLLIGFVFFTLFSETAANTETTLIEPTGNPECILEPVDCYRHETSSDCLKHYWVDDQTLETGGCIWFDSEEYCYSMVSPEDQHLIGITIHQSSCPHTTATSDAPAVSPSFSPSEKPTKGPTTKPSEQPSFVPSVVPTVGPSLNPTSDAPSVSPSVSPSENPTVSPTTKPSVQPSYMETTMIEVTGNPMIEVTGNPVDFLQPGEECEIHLIGTRQKCPDVRFRNRELRNVEGVTECVDWYNEHSELYGREGFINYRDSGCVHSSECPEEERVENTQTEWEIWYYSCPLNEARGRILRKQ